MIFCFFLARLAFFYECRSDAIRLYSTKDANGRHVYVAGASCINALQQPCLLWDRVSRACTSVLKLLLDKPVAFKLSTNSCVRWGIWMDTNVDRWSVVHTQKQKATTVSRSFRSPKLDMKCFGWEQSGRVSNCILKHAPQLRTPGWLELPKHGRPVGQKWEQHEFVRWRVE